MDLIPHCEKSSIIFVHGTRDFKTKVKRHERRCAVSVIKTALRWCVSPDPDHLDIPPKDAI